MFSHQTLLFLNKGFIFVIIFLFLLNLLLGDVFGMLILQELHSFVLWWCCWSLLVVLKIDEIFWCPEIQKIMFTNSWVSFILRIQPFLLLSFVFCLPMMSSDYRDNCRCRPARSVRWCQFHLLMSGGYLIHLKTRTRRVAKRLDLQEGRRTSSCSSLAIMAPVRLGGEETPQLSYLILKFYVIQLKKLILMVGQISLLWTLL